MARDLVLVYPMAQGSEGWAPVVVWSAGLLILLALMGFAIARFRKRFSSTESPSSTGFTLTDLRELHRSGKMTDAEFEVAKKLVLNGLKTSLGSSDRTKPPSGTDKVP